MKEEPVETSGSEALEPIITKNEFQRIVNALNHFYESVEKNKDAE